MLVGRLSGADAGMEAAAGPLAVVHAGSNRARAAAQTALGHGMSVGGRASPLRALVTPQEHRTLGGGRG